MDSPKGTVAGVAFVIKRGTPQLASTGGWEFAYYPRSGDSASIQGCATCHRSAESKDSFGQVQLTWLMSRGPAANFHYDLVDGADDQFLGDRPMVRIRDNNLPPVPRKPDELRLYFVNPHLLIRRSLPI